MTWYAGEDVAERTGVEPSYVIRLVELGILVPEQPDRFSAGDVRRVLMARSLEDAGIPLDDVAAAVRHGALSFSFFDAAGYDRFAGLAPETFQQVSDRTGVPLELLTVGPRGDRDGGAVTARPHARGRDGDRALPRVAGRRGVQPVGDRATAPGGRRQHTPDRRGGGRLVDHGGDRARHRRGQGPGGDRERRPHGPDLAARGADGPRLVPRPSGADLDRQHRRGVRGT